MIVLLSCKFAVLIYKLLSLFSDLLISVCGALFGHVTPNLRALYVVLDDEVTRLMFYYDTPLSELEEELASLTDTEFLADFPNDKTDFKVIVLPYPAKIPQSGLCVYLRYEPSINSL